MSGICQQSDSVFWDQQSYGTYFFENGSSKANLLTMDENIGSDYNGNCIYTGIAYIRELLIVLIYFTGIHTPYYLLNENR